MAILGIVFLLLVSVSAAMAGGCANGWSVLRDHQVMGGIEQDGVSTVDGCKARCRNVDRCLGIDWNRPRSACYTLTGFGGEMRQNEDVDHWEICECVNNWKKSAYQKIFGGEQLKYTDDLKECKTKCEAMRDCVAMDWNKKYETCWAFTSDKAVGRLVTEVDVDHYERCCLDGWDKTRNRQVRGGERQIWARTLDSCKAKCKRMDQCVAIDWNRERDECYTFPNARGQLRMMKNVDHLEICGVSRCLGDWQTIKNHQIPGGKQRKTIHSLAGCKSYCTGADDCGAFDWNKESYKCFTFRKGKNLRANKDVDHWELCQDCGSGWKVTRNYQVPGGTKSNIRVLSRCKAHCRAIDDCAAIDWNKDTFQCFTFGKEGPRLRANMDVDHFKKCERVRQECTNGWTKEVNVEYFGGEEKKHIRNLEICKHWCESMGNCVAIDWHETRRACYTFTSLSGKSRRNNTDVDHLKRCGGSGTEWNNNVTED